MRSVPRVPMLAPLLALLLLACGGRAPDGQVVATVNGEEITRAQLNAALPKGEAAVGGKDSGAVRNTVLDKLIAQQLVVQEAKRQNIDRSQDYLLAMRNAEDQILSDLLSRKILDGLHTPFARNVDQFVRDNPSRFADRAILLVDQVRYPSDRLAPEKLSDARSLDEAAGRLSTAGVRFDRGRATIDTASITPQLYHTLLALRPGEPFIVNEGGMTLVSTIASRQPAPIASDMAQKLALQVIRQQEARAALTRQLEALRRNATIEYQPGFAAPKPAPGTGRGSGT